MAPLSPCPLPRPPKLEGAREGFIRTMMANLLSIYSSVLPRYATCLRSAPVPAMCIILAVLFFNSILTSLASYTWPNYVMDELEHLLVDTGGFNDGGFKRAITPCTNYVSGSQLLGRETAAQWIRVAFHDFATADVKAGTGGIDASIGFETLRPENSGSAMNDSLAFFAPFVNAHVSMADMIALSVVMSAGGCSDPTISIPLRGGRIDATGGGPFGVPEPETDIDETLKQMKIAGFDQSDAIALTACGHTMGSVHHGGFPQVVPESAVTPTNTGGGVHFDATPDVFDIDVVNEYLSWTGQKGGALVTTDNVTVRSDLRLYLSDNNATIKSLSTSSAHFISSCVSLLARMIDTTPATLTDVIVPNVVKPVNVSLTVDEQGGINFEGYIRLLSTTFNADAIVTMSWLSRTGSSSHSYTTTLTPSQAGSSIFGTTYYHQLSTTIDPKAGISAFTISVRDGSSTKEYTNGGRGYPMQDTVVWLPSESGVADNGSVVISAAVLTSAAPTNVNVLFSIPSPQSGTLGPKVIYSSLILSKHDARGLYTLYTGSTQLELANLDQTSIDVVAVIGRDSVVRDSFRKLGVLKG